MDVYRDKNISTYPHTHTPMHFGYRRGVKQTPFPIVILTMPWIGAGYHDF